MSETKYNLEAQRKRNLNTTNSQNNNTVMRKEITVRRKVSAIVAMALAVLVTFTAALNSYGDSNTDPFLSMELKASEQAAYESIIEDQYFEVAVEPAKVIKIYNSDYELLKEVELGEDGVIEDKEAQKLLNRADFLSEFSNTSVYKVLN